MTHDDDCAAIDGMDDKHGKPTYSEKTFPNAGVSTTSST
jgi:hypothetical protein